MRASTAVPGAAATASMLLARSWRGIPMQKVRFEFFWICSLDLLCGAGSSSVTFNARFVGGASPRRCSVACIVHAAPVTITDGERQRHRHSRGVTCTTLVCIALIIVAVSRFACACASCVRSSFLVAARGLLHGTHACRRHQSSRYFAAGIGFVECA